MSVHKTPSGRWKVRWRDYSVLKTDKHGNVVLDKNGKPLPSEPSKVFDRKVDADKHDAKMRLAKASGERLPTSSSTDADMTVKALGDAWRASKSSDWTEKTAGEHEIIQRLHLNPYIGGLVVRKATPQDILTLPGRLTADKRSAGTIRNALADVRHMFRYAVVLGIRDDDPAATVDAVTPKSSKKPQIQPLSPVKIEAIRTAVAARKSKYALRDATIISVLAYVGCRPAEMRGLKWSDWSDEDGRLSIIRQIDSANAEAPTKRAPRSDRRVVLWGPAVDDLTAWRNASKGRGDAYVFPGVAGGPMTTTEYANWRKRIWAKYSGYSKPYVLRHSHASLRVRSGEDRQRIAHHMGHRVATLDSEYTHHFEDFEQDPKPIDPAALIYKARGIEPPEDTADTLAGLSGDEREAVLAIRAKKAKDTAEAAAAADHNAETEAAWDSVAV